MTASAVTGASTDTAPRQSALLHCDLRGIMKMPRLLATCCLLVAGLASADPTRARSPNLKTTPLLRLRGGNVLKLASEQAKTMIYQRARRDDHRSMVCAGRATLGLFLLFQPLQTSGLMDKPIGRATWQLFFAGHFYLRLLWLLFKRKDFFVVPKSRQGKMQKRAVSRCAPNKELRGRLFTYALDARPVL